MKRAISNNIKWAKRLESARCNVYYNSGKYKIHFKACQICIVEDANEMIITQIGTGNYNESTAKQYTDFSLITADKMLGVEVKKLFNDAKY